MYNTNAYVAIRKTVAERAYKGLKQSKIKRENYGFGGYKSIKVLAKLERCGFSFSLILSLLELKQHFQRILQALYSISSTLTSKQASAWVFQSEISKRYAPDANAVVISSTSTSGLSATPIERKVVSLLKR